MHSEIQANSAIVQLDDSKRNSLNSRECQLQNYENIDKTIVRDTVHLNSLTE